MHELSLAQALVIEAEQIIDQQGGQKAVSVSLIIGALSGVNEQAFRFAYPEAIKGTKLEGSLLTISHQALQVFCPSCQQSSALDDLPLHCPQCFENKVTVTQGYTFTLSQLEIE